MSGLFRSTLIKGNRLTDFAQSTATVGIVIPFGYGSFPCDGNVIWAPLPPKEHRSVKRQGKGGVKQETFTYTLSYAVAFALGPIYGYRWIKRNGKVVYTNDEKAPIEDKEYAAKWLQKATLYYGLRSQLPDSTIESYEGTGRVSAFRDLAYIVVEDDDVTEGGGAVPTYEACVIASPPTVYVTSRPYPILDVSSMGENLEFVKGGFGISPITIDPIDSYASITGGSINDLLIKFDIPPEGINTHATILNGQLGESLTHYDIPAESMNDDVIIVQSHLNEILVRYINYPPESLNTSATIFGGSLE